MTSVLVHDTISVLIQCMHVLVGGVRRETDLGGNNCIDHPDYLNN